MANLGIILRKDTKANLIENPPIGGELVFATDTDEVGSLSNNELVWQSWNPSTLTPLAYIGNDLPNDSLGEDGRRYMFNDVDGIREFIKSEGVWEEIIYGKEKSWLDNNIEPAHDSTYPFLGKYTYEMFGDFVSQDDYDVVTLQYMDGVGLDFIKLNGENEFNVGYIPSEPDDVVTLGHLLSGDIEYVTPTSDPFVEGAVWNDNGVLKISEGFFQFNIKVTSTEPPIISASSGGSVEIKDNSDGTYNVRSKSAITAFYFNASYGARHPENNSITKVEVLFLKSVISLYRSFYYLQNVTEFICPFDETENVWNFNEAFRGMNSITSFPLINTSTGTNFKGAWNQCTNLVTIPLLDLSNGTDMSSLFTSCNALESIPLLDFSSCLTMRWAFLQCFALASFPLLDTSKVTEFDHAWTNCSSLTSFPLLDMSSALDVEASWNNCTALTSFPLVNTGNVANFKNAWNNCPLISVFPALDTSKGVDFTQTWYQCESIAVFPVLDMSSGEIFEGTWARNYALTAFPTLDVSSGTNFNNAWNNCTGLPHCPGGNEITIPVGASTTDMCLGI